MIMLGILTIPATCPQHHEHESWGPVAVASAIHDIAFLKVMHGQLHIHSQTIRTFIPKSIC